MKAPGIRSASTASRIRRPRHAGVLEFLPFNQDLNRFVLVVQGAAAQTQYDVTWGSQTKRFSGAELTKGINLAAEFLDNPFGGAFKKVEQAVQTQQNYETPLTKVLLHNMPLMKEEAGARGRRRRGTHHRPPPGPRPIPGPRRLVGRRAGQTYDQGLAGAVTGRGSGLNSLRPSAHHAPGQHADRMPLIRLQDQPVEDLEIRLPAKQRHPSRRTIQHMIHPPSRSHPHPFLACHSAHQAHVYARNAAVT